MQPRPELINPELESLAAMDAREFKLRFKGSPLERTGRKRLLRNVAIAMGNSGDVRFLPQLEAWSGDSSNGCGPQINGDATARRFCRETARVRRGRGFSFPALRLRSPALRLLA